MNGTENYGFSESTENWSTGEWWYSVTRQAEFGGFQIELLENGLIFLYANSWAGDSQARMVIEKIGDCPQSYMEWLQILDQHGVECQKAVRFQHNPNESHNLLDQFLAH